MCLIFLVCGIELLKPLNFLVKGLEKLLFIITAFTFPLICANEKILGNSLTASGWGLVAKETNKIRGLKNNFILFSLSFFLSFCLSIFMNLQITLLFNWS